jgi:hypothetical protein
VPTCIRKLVATDELIGVVNACDDRGGRAREIDSGIGEGVGWSYPTEPNNRTIALRNNATRSFIGVRFLEIRAHFAEERDKMSILFLAGEYLTAQKQLLSFGAAVSSYARLGRSRISR